jgi:ribonucleoside-diphosphate reductase alpha chain
MKNLKIIFDNNKEEKFSKEKLVIDIFELMCYIGEPNIKYAEKIVNTICDEINKNSLEKIHEEDLKKHIKIVLKEKNPELLQAFIINKSKNTKSNFDLKIKKEIFSYVFNINKNIEDFDINNYINNIKSKFIELDVENTDLYNIIFKYIYEGCFYPSINILKNINTKYNNLLSSYPILLEDNLESIFENLKLSSQLQKRDSSTSLNLSKIRSKNKMIRSINKKACGPARIIDLYNSAKELINSNCIKNTKNLFYINIEHPDILDFIKKSETNKKNNYVILINNRFMKNLCDNKSYIINNKEDNLSQTKINTINNNNEEYSNIDDQQEEYSNNEEHAINTNTIFNFIINSIYNHNNIDLVFIDQINEENIFNNYKSLEISSKGYQPVFEKEGFVDGVIDVSKFVNYVGDLKLLDWNSLKEVILNSVEFLDICIDLSKDLDDDFYNIKKNTRRMYLSIIGYSKLLDKLNIPYNSSDALLLGEKLSEFISYFSKYKSIELAKTKGPFNKYIKSKYDMDNFKFKKYTLQKTLFDNQKLAKRLLSNRPKTDWVELNNKLRKYGIRNSSTYSIIFSDIFSVVNDTTNTINPLENINYSININGQVISKTYDLFLYNNEINNKDIDINNVEDLIKNKSKNKFILAKDVDPDFLIKMQNSFDKYCDGVCNSYIYFNKNTDLKTIKNSIIKSYNLKNKVFLPKIITESNIYFDTTNKEY